MPYIQDFACITSIVSLSCSHTLSLRKMSCLSKFESLIGAFPVADVFWHKIDKLHYGFVTTLGVWIRNFLDEDISDFPNDISLFDCTQAFTEKCWEFFSNNYHKAEDEFTSVEFEALDYLQDALKKSATKWHFQHFSVFDSDRKSVV